MPMQRRQQWVAVIDDVDSVALMMMTMKMLKLYVIA